MKRLIQMHTHVLYGNGRRHCMSIPVGNPAIYVTIFCQFPLHHWPQIKMWVYIIILCQDRKLKHKHNESVRFYFS